MKWLSSLLPGKRNSMSPRESEVLENMRRDWDRPLISDRGSARHFHGREGIRRNFARMLAGAKESSQGGTTFLIQGAPGAGKTALLHQLGKDAGDNWAVVRIKPMALESPVVMAQALGKVYIESRKKVLKSSAKIVGVDLNTTLSGTQTVTGVLQDCIGDEDSVILVLDEAQHLATPSSHAAGISIRDTLDAITNGQTGRKVVLVLAGLGHTWEALKDRGLSRLRRGCSHIVGRFRHKETARRVVKDWLSEYGCDPDHMGAWIEALVRASDDWPQHVICCVAAALDHFDSQGDQPTIAAVRAVLDAAREEKHVFYAARSAGIGTDDVALLGIIVGACGPDSVYDRMHLLSLLSVREREESARTVLGVMVANGVLATRTMRPKGKVHAYYVPIPSMERYLIGQAIDFAARQPNVCQELYGEIRDVILSRRGVIKGRMEDLLDGHFTHMGTGEEGPHGSQKGFEQGGQGIER
ncbi:MAG: ATP-binding protein [Bacteroidota bacterium]|nr:ATP-binding protein [Bacteroidota bacterium]